MPAIGWKVGKELFTYEEAMTIAKRDGWFMDYPPAALKAFKRDRVDKHWLSPSAAGGCHRQRALQMTTDYYTDLVGEWSPGVGTAIHDWLQRFVQKGNGPEWTEMTLRTPLLVPLRDGTIHQYEIVGTADYFDEETGRAYDYKTISEFSYWHNGKRERVEKEIPRPHHILQAQLYAFLLRENGFEVNEYWLWYAKLHSDGERRAIKVELWDNDEIEHIASEIAEPLAWFEKTGELPQNKFDSKNPLCRYCPVSATCRSLAKEGK